MAEVPEGGEIVRDFFEPSGLKHTVQRAVRLISRVDPYRWADQACVSRNAVVTDPCRTSTRRISS